MKDKKKDKRIIVKAFAVIIIVLLVLALILKLFQWFLAQDRNEKNDIFTASREDISYYLADYDEAPDDDEFYMSLERRVWFTDMNGVSTYLDESDGNGNNYAKALMYKYFTSVMAGDTAAYADLLSDSYKANYTVNEKFTPQKLYDIEVSFEQSEQRDGVYYQYYRVFYKIYKNNGTFRADIGSDVALDMSFELVYVENGYKINSVGYRTIKDNGYGDDEQEGSDAEYGNS